MKSLIHYDYANNVLPQASISAEILTRYKIDIFVMYTGIPFHIGIVL